MVVIVIVYIVVFVFMQVIKIELINLQVVYVFSYNFFIVYGIWLNSVYLLVYLLFFFGEQFIDSFVKGFGYSFGVVIIWVLFSSIDWDDDDYYYYDDDYCYGDYLYNGDNININVNNFNYIIGENLLGNYVNWQYNFVYCGYILYFDNMVVQCFYQINVFGGLSVI